MAAPQDADPFPPDASDGEAVLRGVAARAGAQAAGENFPVALRLLPRRPRHDLMALYRFARFVDDVGDEAPGGPRSRTALLALIEQDLHEVADGVPRLAAVRAVVPLVRERGVPLQPFLDLVAANRCDQVVASYATFADLLGYCRLSAAPIGTVVLHLAGAASEANLADSAAVCAALQVLEHCQDVREDALAGRVYIPADELAAAGVGRRELCAAVSSPRLRAVVRLQVQRAGDLLRAGGPLVHRLGGWARVAVSGYVAGGEATAAALHRSGFRVLEGQVRPSRLGTAARAVLLAGGLR